MDVLGGIELGSRYGGRFKHAFALAGVFLMVGWAYRWPVIHPFVQGILDDRRDQMVRLFTDALDGYGKDDKP